jgi:hypothetical protein
MSKNELYVEITTIPEEIIHTDGDGYGDGYETNNNEKYYMQLNAILWPMIKYFTSLTYCMCVFTGLGYYFKAIQPVTDVDVMAFNACVLSLLVMLSLAIVALCTEADGLVFFILVEYPTALWLSIILYYGMVYMLTHTTNQIPINDEHSDVILAIPENPTYAYS